MTAADRVRRGRDMVAAAAVLIIASPAIVVVAVLVRVRLGRPVLFRQQRLGRDGTPFTLYKFRTMRDAEPGRESSAFDHERTTRLGRFLRAASLDGFPGFYNLLRGDISLVGPRPLPVAYWERFVGEEYRRFEVRPGITGLAQIAGRNGVDWDRRLALDVRYVASRTLLGDLRIVLRTIPVVLTGRGVNEGGPVAMTMSELPIGRSSG